MQLRVREILEDFVALMYPHYCEACDVELVKGEEILCSGCILDLPRTNYHSEKFNPLYRRLHGRIRIEQAMAFFVFRKSGKVQKLLHALKYRNRPDIGRCLGLVYGEEIRRSDSYQPFDMIIPVPLHKSRKSLRGYNQSEEFANGLSVGLASPIASGLLKRVIKTQTQTKRTRLNRWENVREVFEVTEPAKVYGKQILLVDDIITTGATAEACGQQLLEAGCRSLSIACLAVTK